VPEPTSRPCSRARLREVAARVGALCAAGALSASLTLPAAALGEDGPFDFPAETDTLAMVPGAVTRIPLDSLVDDQLETEVDFGTALLTVPEDAEPAVQGLMEVAEDGRSITVAGEGTWTLLGADLVFTPLSGVEGPVVPISLTIEGLHDVRSRPAEFTPELVELENIPVRGSAGQNTQIPLDGQVPEGGKARLELAGLPPGSTLVSDGSRAIVPDQGIWQLSADGDTLSHAPAGPGLGRQVDPMRLVVQDEEGTVLRAIEARLTVPIISDLDWSAPYGEDILFVVGEGQQFIDPSTLELVPLAGEENVESTDEGTTVVVPGQGSWTLDRASATVRFSPESAEVQDAAPMGISGGDGKGATSAVALLSTAYPMLMDRSAAATPGSVVQFDLTTGVRDVRSESLRFDPDSLPAGTELSDDGTTAVVDGEGTWHIDFDARAVTMTPEEGFTGRAEPMGITAQGIFADNEVHGSLTARFAPELATMRDDEERTAPGTSVTVDLLGNDTAGSASQALLPQSVKIASLSATNLTELKDSRGKRLVIPGEGTFAVMANGAVTFMPEDGFFGRTTPIQYEVLDATGNTTSANLVVEVDRTLAGTEESAKQVTGINALLAGLMPSAPATSLVFSTIVTLLLFGGGVALWIGLRMENERRRWED